jgi:hypothetical protein
LVLPAYQSAEFTGGTVALDDPSEPDSDAQESARQGPESCQKPNEANDVVAEICKAYFGNADFVSKTRQVLAMVRSIEQNTAHQVVPAQRVQRIRNLLNQFDKLDRAIRAVDLPYLLYPVDPKESGERERSVRGNSDHIAAPSRIRAEKNFASFLELLSLQRENCERALRRAQSIPRRGAPEIPDSLDFAVESLMSIWVAASGSPASASFKRGGFGAFALDLLAEPQGLFLAKRVRAVVRKSVKPRAYTRQLKSAPNIVSKKMGKKSRII